MKRLAAIDVGTNSVRSIIVEVPRSGRFRLLDDEKEHTRLGRGLAASGRMSEEAMGRTTEALVRMVEIARRFEAEPIRIVATSAVRTASNGEAFRARLAKEVGLPIEVISEEEEGRLAYLSAEANFDMEGRVAVMDIGGGSVEIVRATGGAIESIVSLPLGAVVLTELFVTADPIAPKPFRELKRHVRRSVADAVGRPDPGAVLVGSGGTVTTLASMAAHLHDGGAPEAHGQEVTRAELVHLLASLKRGTQSERLQTAGLPATRADIILAGLVVVDEVMRALGSNLLKVNARGIREGLVLDTIRQSGSRKVGPDRMRSALEFARRCHFDKSHSLHVTELALSLFDQLAAPLGLDPEDRSLLEAAGVLHDVGYYIAYDQHHKHSYHLITYASLPGFSRREQELIASVARYHRGALPKGKHDSMRRLAPEDRRRAERLGALLRLADGLDRTRSQRVRVVHAELGGNALSLVVSGDGDLGVEVYGARAKGDLFERAFGLRVDVSSQPEA